MNQTSIHYRTDQPRLSVSSPVNAEGDSREMEIGQAESASEAAFWHSIGYAVHVAQWNGRYFADRQTIFPDQPLEG
jgi:hypothetical protein